MPASNDHGSGGGEDDESGPYLFGDLLALARASWIRQMAADMAAAGYDDYRRSDAAVMRILLGSGPVSITGMGEILGVSRQAARKLLDGLLERSFAETTRHQTDARAVEVALTAEGRRYATAVVATIHKLNRELASRVPASDLRRADSVLRAALSDPGERERADRLVSPPGRVVR
ncbi:MAG TPA: MarR family winged helix-turn-helix transcriptional regulator [Acidimicrobiales bacterium]|nr:MarR family winged helix-turn-helix transcriptional regulator [Acidimicrobiales bacterium]